MEQVEGGDLIVNRGNESRPKADTATERNFNAVEGYDAAYKLAQVSGAAVFRFNLLIVLLQGRHERAHQEQLRTTSSKLSTTNITLSRLPSCPTLPYNDQESGIPDDRGATTFAIPTIPM